MSDAKRKAASRIRFAAHAAFHEAHLLHAYSETTESRPSGGGSGWIRVGIRVRPLADDRKSTGQGLEVNTAEGTVSDGKKAYSFSDVYQGQDNASLFEVLGRPLVARSLEGYNGTLMAYGQTGSGKTYTIGEIGQLGTSHEGIAHRMIRALFTEIGADHDHSYEVGMQFVQIHVERIYDLLGEWDSRSNASTTSSAASSVRKGPSTAALQLREDKTQGVYVQGAVTVPVETLEASLDVLRHASTRLTFAATQMNAHSSRSHAVCQVCSGPSHRSHHLPRLALPPRLTFSITRRGSGICHQDYHHHRPPAVIIAGEKKVLIAGDAMCRQPQALEATVCRRLIAHH